MTTPIVLAVMLSGKGSNAKNLILRSIEESDLFIGLIVSTRPNEELEHFCRDRKIPFKCISPWDSFLALQFLQDHAVHYVILAGFLKKITPEILQAFPKRILNLHPSLLPKYGGKGMFGIHVHRKVLENRESESGITIHLVNEAYDEGKILAQFSCFVSPEDSAESLEKKIQQLEMAHFPEVVFRYCKASFKC
ncbi:MAG: phosphoribosylglycinamide formyltransferase [Bacteroidetes bacterium]|nr:phosphoribosylglycinamide formyltransferase [Bacteroidota bacterium]